MRAIRKPADVNSKKEIQESLKTLRKKTKIMKKDDSMCMQYIDRVAFDTIQGVFQGLHLYIISTNKYDLIDEVVEYLRNSENCYDIANRMQKAAIARAEFNGAQGVSKK